MDVEASFEVESLFERGDRSAAEAGCHRPDPHRRRIPGARAPAGRPHAGARHSASRALLRAAFPVLHADALVENSRERNLDAALVAGLIRQVSTWNPDAVSPVGARGLMQLMPAVGASIASGRGYPVWNPVLLFDPDVSMQLGTLHLASDLRGQSDPTRALAAYNAGASRVVRWSRRPGRAIPNSSRSGSRSWRRGITCAPSFGIARCTRGCTDFESTAV
jgi:soluble lytic murein transglycosylase